MSIDIAGVPIKIGDLSCSLRQHLPKGIIISDGHGRLRTLWIPDGLKTLKNQGQISGKIHGETAQIDLAKAQGLLDLLRPQGLKGLGFGAKFWLRKCIGR